MSTETQESDPTGSAVAMAIAKALQLPTNITRLTLSFSVDKAPVVVVELSGFTTGAEIIAAAAELASYELRPIDLLAPDAAERGLRSERQAWQEF